MRGQEVMEDGGWASEAVALVSRPVGMRGTRFAADPLRTRMPWAMSAMRWRFTVVRLGVRAGIVVCGYRNAGGCGNDTLAEGLDAKHKESRDCGEDANE